MKMADLRELSDRDLHDHQGELYNKLFELKNKLAYESGANLVEYRNLRKELARVKTLINERRQGVGA